MKEMTDRYSDFGSAKEWSSSSSSSGSDNKGDFKTPGRKKKRKQRQSITPTRDSFLKKPNTAASPQYYY